MIVVFDTNAYRNIVSRISKDEAVAKVVDIKHKEFEKGIIPIMRSLPTEQLNVLMMRYPLRYLRVGVGHEFAI